MSHQCRCGRDVNNNYVSYTSAYANGNSNMDREASASLSGVGGVGGGGGGGGGSSKSLTSAGAQTQLTAKVMFGTVGAIKELREKEKSRHATTRAGDRRN